MKDRLSVFWIRADSLANFIADFSRLLPLIEPAFDESSTPQDIGTLLERTREKLESLAGDWLLILDNADHLDDFIGTSNGSTLSISKYVPRHGRILITTRDRRFQGSIAAASDGLCVEPMTVPEARDLLVKSVPQHLVQPSAVNMLMADDLVNELGCLPLAIAQAAANIVDQQMSFSEYVGLFRHEKRRRADLMTSPAYDFANQDVRNSTSSVAITWKISIDALEKQSPLSVTFLQYLACFHWRDVPRVLLRHLPEFRKLDDVAFLQLTKKPLALSLIDQTLDQDLAFTTYSVHPVLHEIMATEIAVQEKHRILDQLTPAMSRLFPIVPNPAVAKTWSLASLLAPHLSRQLSLCQETDYASETVAILMFSLSQFHGHSQMNGAAADLADAGLSMANKLLGPDSDLIPYFRGNAIRSMHDAGRYESVEKECRLALEILESRAVSLERTAYIKEKVLLLTDLFNAIRGMQDYKRLGAVNEELRQCHQLEQWSPGENAVHRHNIAFGLLHSGKRAEAKEINDELLRYCETEEGKKAVDKKLHLIMLNLKLLIIRMGPDVWQQLEEIVALYERIFFEHLSHFGIRDRETWISLNNYLGSLTQSLRMEEVGEVLWSVLPAAIAAKVKADGRIAISMGEIQQTSHLYLSCLYEGQVSGADDGPRTAEFARLLERWSYIAGMTDVAQGLADTTSSRYLNSLNSMGVHYQTFGRYAEAEAIHRRLIHELQGRQDHELNELSHYNLMLAIARAGRVDEAFEFRKGHQTLIAPMEDRYGTLEQRIEERQRDLRVYEEAKERIAQGSLRQSDQWWAENASVVGRVGTLLGHKVSPPD
jgi:tetratricopeptide (TPR) repeat protein